MTTGEFPPPPWGAATLLLADAAHIYDGKLSLLGGCFTTLIGPTPHALIALLTIDRPPAGGVLEFTVALTHDDGEAVMLSPGLGGSGRDLPDQPVAIDARVTLAPVTTTVVVPWVAGLGPLPLAAGTYYWVLRAGGRDHAALTFDVVATHDSQD